MANFIEECITTLESDKYDYNDIEFRFYLNDIIRFFNSKHLDFYLDEINRINYDVFEYGKADLVKVLKFYLEQISKK